MFLGVKIQFQQYFSTKIILFVIFFYIGPYMKTVNLSIRNSYMNNFARSE